MSSAEVASDRGFAWSGRSLAVRFARRAATEGRPYTSIPDHAPPRVGLGRGHGRPRRAAPTRASPFARRRETVSDGGLGARPVSDRGFAWSDRSLAVRFARLAATDRRPYTSSPDHAPPRVGLGPQLRVVGALARCPLREAGGHRRRPYTSIPRLRAAASGSRTRPGTRSGAATEGRPYTSIPVCAPPRDCLGRGIRDTEAVGHEGLPLRVRARQGSRQPGRQGTVRR